MRAIDPGAPRRRMRVVRIFPNEPRFIPLTTALAIERNERWLERCYLRMQSMNEKQTGETRVLRQSA